VKGASLLRAGALGGIGARHAATLTLAEVRSRVGRRLRGGAGPDLDALNRQRGRSLRRACEEAGPVFIKLAQILSSRRDLFPPALLQELERLQDQVPPFDSRLVPGILLSEFGKGPGELFRDFEMRPVASASIAQVHRGTLHDGREVAVKIIRPGVAEAVERDVGLMRQLVRVATRFLGPHSAENFVDTFCDMLRMQVDLTLEAKNNLRFRDLHAEDHEVMKVPELVPELSSRRVMTMEFIHGMKPTDPQMPEERQRRMAERGLIVVYKMILKGLIHADMHPGNIIIDEQDRYCFLDLGIVDDLSWKLRKQFFESWFATFGDGEGAPFARMMLQFSERHQVEDFDVFAAEVTKMLRANVAGRALSEMAFGGTMVTMEALQRKYGIIATPPWVSLALMLVTIEGLARHFDPNLSIAKSIEPHLLGFLRQLYLMNPALEKRRSARARKSGRAEAAIADPGS
jgi:ubiquinone biosynthesis protein